MSEYQTEILPFSISVSIFLFLSFFLPFLLNRTFVSNHQMSSLVSFKQKIHFIQVLPILFDCLARSDSFYFFWQTIRFFDPYIILYIIPFSILLISGCDKIKEKRKKAGTLEEREREEDTCINNLLFVTVTFDIRKILLVHLLLISALNLCSYSVNKFCSFLSISLFRLSSQKRTSFSDSQNRHS